MGFRAWGQGGGAELVDDPTRSGGAAGGSPVREKAGECRGGGGENAAEAAINVAASSRRMSRVSWSETRKLWFGAPCALAVAGWLLYPPTHLPSEPESDKEALAPHATPKFSDSLAASPPVESWLRAEPSSAPCPLVSSWQTLPAPPAYAAGLLAKACAEAPTIAVLPPSSSPAPPALVPVSPTLVCHFLDRHLPSSPPHLPPTYPHPPNSPQPPPPSPISDFAPSPPLNPTQTSNVWSLPSVRAWRRPWGRPGRPRWRPGGARRLRRGPARRGRGDRQLRARERGRPRVQGESPCPDKGDAHRRSTPRRSTPRRSSPRTRPPTHQLRLAATRRCASCRRRCPTSTRSCTCRTRRSSAR